MNNKRIRVGVAGASGRMGRHLVAVLQRTPMAQLSAAWVRPERLKDAAWQRSLGDGVCITDDADTFAKASDVVIDFVAPSVLQKLVLACARAGAGYVVATTGLSAEDHQTLKQAAQTIPVLQAANFSLGVNVLLGLVEQAAHLLGSWDMEIIEAHHRHKRDAPSGTALALGHAIQHVHPDKKLEVTGLSRTAPRDQASVGISVIRAGEIAGDHTVLFAGTSERLELSHRAQSPALFAEGAWVAAQFVANAQPGMWSMQDVLAAARL